MQKGYCLVSIKMIIKMHGLGRYLKFRNKDKIFSLYPVSLLQLLENWAQIGSDVSNCTKLRQVDINTIWTAFELNFDFYQSFKQHMIHINIETKKSIQLTASLFFQK